MSSTNSQPQPHPDSRPSSTVDHSPIEQRDWSNSSLQANDDPVNIESSPPFQYNASLHPQTTITSPYNASSVSAGLRLQTDQVGSQRVTEYLPSPTRSVPPSDLADQTHFNAGLPVRSSSIRSVLGSRAHRSDSLSPASAISSPGIGPLVEMTPLPSPISLWRPPGFDRLPADLDNDSEADTAIRVEDLVPEVMNYTRSSPKKKGVQDRRDEVYNVNATAHARNRSLSEYVPEGIQVPRPRNIVVSTSGAPYLGQSSLSPPDENHMHREQYLAIQRGLSIPIAHPPTPPDSNQGKDSDEFEALPSSTSTQKESRSVHYEARTVRGDRLRRWRALRHLGNGTFSRVMLATSEKVEETHSLLDSVSLDDEIAPASLVAVKICDQCPAGGADEEKIATSIRRETELMKAIHHPSLIHLKAVNVCERQTLLVLNYCAGGDLFDLARSDLNILIPSVIRRIFAELVSAVQYLHEQYIVHRDIKLENVLVNLPTAAFHTIGDWQSYPHPVVTLSDLGLGRYIPKPPESPLLETRCGSEDYAAPEVLIGQEYDGRATDAWALGVLLYALMEGRLPFDPVPGARRKSPTSHRIARCEWQWVKWADEDGEWDPVKGEKLNGAREIVEGLLTRTRSRWSLSKVQKTEWVARAINVKGGLRREEDNRDED